MIGNCEKDWVLEAKEGCYIVEELLKYIMEQNLFFPKCTSNVHLQYNGMYKLHKSVELMHDRDLDLLAIKVNAWMLYINHKRCIL